MTTPATAYPTDRLAYGWNPFQTRLQRNVKRLHLRWEGRAECGATIRTAQVYLCTSDQYICPACIRRTKAAGR